MPNQLVDRKTSVVSYECEECGSIFKTEAEAFECEETHEEEEHQH